MTAARRSHEDESNHPSQIGAPGRSAGGANRADPVFQPNSGFSTRRKPDRENRPASCITFLSEQAFAPQNTRFWSRSRVWFQFTVGEDKPPMLSVDNRGKGVLSMDCSAKRSPL